MNAAAFPSPGRSPHGEVGNYPLPT